MLQVEYLFCSETVSGVRPLNASQNFRALWVATSRMADGLLEAVRGLWLADPGLGPKPLLAKLREQQPNLEWAPGRFGRR